MKSQHQSLTRRNLLKMAAALAAAGAVGWTSDTLEAEGQEVDSDDDPFVTPFEPYFMGQLKNDEPFAPYFISGQEPISLDRYEEIMGAKNCRLRWLGEMDKHK